ncbi:MAG: ribonuclease D [Nocardioides sp.]
MPPADDLSPDALALDAEPAVALPADPLPPAAPLLRLRDGLPRIIDTDAGLIQACDAIAAGTGPVAIDAERASGYRYSARAYLIQLRREGAGTALLDPIAFDSLAPLAKALDGTEWILHAATQDLPCLNELGLYPTRLFDTELAGRLLGYPRVGLASLVETLLGHRMAKEHSAVDWSTRPLPEPWLEYAALDVEVLVELRDVLAHELVVAGKDFWAAEEFDWLRGFIQPTRVDQWRRTSGLHKVRGRRALGAVRALWTTRDQIATERDVTPTRIIPDSAIVAAALAMPATRTALKATKGFYGRGADRYAGRWVAVLAQVRDLPESQLPSRTPRADGPPPPRAWADKDPVAAKRLQLAREAITTLSEEQDVPAENLLTPDFVRRVLWTPPETREEEPLTRAMAMALRDLGARAWQVRLVSPILSEAVLRADREASASPVTASESPSETP